MSDTPQSELYEQVEKLFNLKISSSGNDITIKMANEQMTVPYEDFLLLRQSIENLVVEYGTDKLAGQFEKLKMPHQMYIVGGILHLFTAGLPGGSGFAELSIENSDWQCLLVRKGSGYQKEVDALIKATE